MYLRSKAGRSNTVCHKVYRISKHVFFKTMFVKHVARWNSDVYIIWTHRPDEHDPSQYEILNYLTSLICWGHAYLPSSDNNMLSIHKNLCD